MGGGVSSSSPHTGRAVSTSQFLHAEIPEHADEAVGEGIEIDVEFAFCGGNQFKSVRFCPRVGYVRSTSFFV